MKKVLIITNIPSYHQVDLFNEIANSNKCDLMVFYLLKKTVDRYWNKDFEIKHPHKFLKYNHILKNRGVYYNPSIFKDLAKVNPDTVILTQYANITQQSVLYYLWLFRRNRNIIFWSEKPGIPFYEVPIVRFNILRKLFRKISLLPLSKNENVEIWGIGKKSVNYFKRLVSTKVENYPYFLDTNRFSNSSDRNYDGKINVLFAGKFNKRKGFDILLDFLEESKPEFLENFQFTLIGTGNYQDRIKALSECNVNINYLGFVERQEMPFHYCKNDVFLFPGRYDGWGMVINEAMANGLIVMATNKIGAVEDVVNDRENGLIITEEVSSIREKLTWILNNKDSLKHLSTSAKKSAVKNDVKTGSELFFNLVK